jgi:hypothetical protein
MGTIQRYITEGGQLDVARVKKVDRKLKKCVNPEFIPGTEAYVAHPSSRLHFRIPIMQLVANNNNNNNNNNNTPP